MYSDKQKPLLNILIIIISIALICFLIDFFIMYNKTKEERNNYNNINDILSGEDFEVSFPIETNKSNYYITKSSFSSNGINLSIYIKDNIKPKLALYSTEEKLYDLKEEEDNNYSITLDITSLNNGVYKMYIKTDKDYYVVNKQDLLDKLIRSKIQNKLLTLLYKDDIMSFKIEDFNYEYDILIDPGHGGIDGGTYNEKITEAKLNLMQSLYEKKRYEDHGLKVQLARTDDGDGMLMGDESWNRARLRGYAIGYYGVFAKIVYSNHHNSSPKSSMSGFEILVSSSLNKDELAPEIKIANELLKVYPTNLITNNYQIYSRNADTGNVHNKIDGKIYNYIDYYATIRIPLELYNVKTVTYESAYMSNTENFNWYYDNYKKVSEAKIKHYVESLGKTYIPI